MQEGYDRREKNWVLGVTALASFMMALDSLVITTAFATIRADFGSSVETLQWTVNAYNLSFAVLLLTGAALGDRSGAAGCSPPASRCSCWRRSPARWPAPRSADRGARGARRRRRPGDAAGDGDPERRVCKGRARRALGIFSGVTGFALIIGPAIGGFITEGFGWRWIFWINLPIGLIAIALIFARLRESFGPKAAWIFRACCWSRSRRSRWYGACCAAIRSGGPAPR